jgi:hypothetical protein
MTQFRALPRLLLVTLIAALPAAAAFAERAAPGHRADEPVPRLTVRSDVLEHLSGPAYLSTSEGLRRATSPREDGVPPPRDEDTLISITAASAVNLYTRQVTNDAEQDVEPAVMAVTLANGTVRTTKTYIKGVTIGGQLRFRNYFASTTNLTTWSHGQMPIPAGYQQTADPLMDANVFGNGVAPYRMYTVGIVYQAMPFATPNAIGVWRSDTGGATWTAPTLADVNTDSRYFVDKPDLATSWNSVTRGHVYIAYVKLDSLNVNNTQLLVRRSTDGGLTFGAASLVTTGRVQGAQIVVSSSTGNVYVVWADFAANQLRMASSNSAASSWSAPQTAASGPLVPLGTNLGGNVRAGTLPMLRYNGINGSLALTWHEHDFAGSPRADIYYTRFTGTWMAKVKVNANSTNDQFMPALDYDHTGNLVITYYDRSRDFANSSYEEAWTQITPTGTPLASAQIGLFNDPNLYGNRFIGDYQDIWFWIYPDATGDRFNAGWIRQPAGGQGNLFLTGIQ